MKKPQFIKPIFDLNIFLSLADFLVKSDDSEMQKIGRTMRETFQAGMVETEGDYEESNSLGSPENYENSSCKSGNCD